MSMYKGDSGKELYQQALNGGSATATATAVALPATGSGGTSAPGWGGASAAYPSASIVGAPPAAYGAPVTATATAVAATATVGAVPVAAAPSYGGGGGSSSGSLDLAFFTDYADTVREIDSLKTIDATIASLKQTIASNQRTISERDGQLSRARKDQVKIEKRLNRNENPRFFHYMQFNRKEKVEKLKQTKNNCENMQEQWMSQKQKAEGDLKTAQGKLANANNTAHRRDSLAQKRQQMYDQVVASVPATPRLSQIESNITAQNAALAREQGLLQQVDSVINQLRQGQQLYNQSLGMLRQAMANNQTAQVVNFMDRDRGPDYFERMQQAQRDRLINESQMPAQQAYHAIENAWRIFPAEARQRYPTVCAQIGHTPMPQLRGANFGNAIMAGAFLGNTGDFINNARSRNKIQENMGILQQCSQLVERQIQAIGALRNAIATNISQMEGQLKTLGGQRVEERNSIFESVRARVLGAPGAGAGGAGYSYPAMATATAAYA